MHAPDIILTFKFIPSAKHCLRQEHTRTESENQFFRSHHDINLW